VQEQATIRRDYNARAVVWQLSLLPTDPIEQPDAQFLPEVSDLPGQGRLAG
jgi:hypothetical protein